MPNFRVEINRAAVRDLLLSPEVTQELEQRGERIAAAAGDGNEVQTFRGRNRVRITVRTATPAARHREAASRSLTKALDAGRG